MLRGKIVPSIYHMKAVPSRSEDVKVCRIHIKAISRRLNLSSMRAKHVSLPIVRERESEFSFG